MMLQRLLMGMDRRRWRPSVVSLRDRGTLGPAIQESGVPVAIVGMRGSVPTPWAAVRLRREVNRLKPHLVQGWMYHGNLAATADQMTRRARVPVIWNIRYTPDNEYAERPATDFAIRIGAWLSSSATRIIYNSKTSAQRHAELGYATGGTSVIPNGFDVDYFAPSELSRRAFRERLGLSDTTLLIGRVGRYHPMKDYSTFLKAARIVASEAYDVRFVLAGKGVDRHNSDLAGLVSALGLTNSVYLLGEVLPIRELIQSLDVVCSSSAYGESFPTVLGEGMACGVPCVATDVGDSSWIVGDAGVIVAPKDHEALANACSRVLAMDVGTRRALGDQGRDRVIRYFSLPAIIQQYESLYEDVLAAIESH